MSNVCSCVKASEWVANSHRSISIVSERQGRGESYSCSTYCCNCDSFVLFAVGKTRSNHDFITDSPSWSTAYCNWSISCIGDFGEWGLGGGWTCSIEWQFASNNKDLASYKRWIEYVAWIVLISIELDGKLMSEGWSCTTSSQWSCSDPNRLSSYISILFVLYDHVTVNSHKLTSSRVHVHKDCPVSIDSHILSWKGKSSFRPLTCITPNSNKVFFYEFSRLSRAKILTVDCSDVSCFEVGSIFGTGAELEGSISFSIIMIELPIDAWIFIEVAIWSDKVSAVIKARLGRSNRPNLIELSVESVVEFEENGRVTWSHVVRWGHWEVVEVQSSEPPNVVDAASDVRHGVGLLFIHWVHLFVFWKDLCVWCRCLRNDVLRLGDFLCFQPNQTEQTLWFKLTEGNRHQLHWGVTSNWVVPHLSTWWCFTGRVRGQMLVVECYCCWCSLGAVEWRACECTVQIIEDLSLWPIHEQSVTCNIVKGSIRNINFLDWVTEE